MVAHLITKYKHEKINCKEHLEIIRTELKKCYGVHVDEDNLKSVINISENITKTEICDSDPIEEGFYGENIKTNPEISYPPKSSSDSVSLSSINTITGSTSSSTKNEQVNISDKSISFDLKGVNIKDSEIKVKKFMHYRYSYEVPLKPNRDVIKNTEENKIFNNCCVEDDNFKLNSIEMENATEQNSNYSVNMRLYDLVREKYKLCNNVCTISFKTINHTKKCYILYAFCAFKDCCKFKFVLNKSDNNIAVFRNKLHLCHPGYECKVQQRGIKRVVKQAELLYKPAIKLYNEQFLKKPVDLAKLGNPSEFITKSSSRKIRSQALSRLDKDKDPIIDLYYMKQEEYKDYIQKVAHPLEVYMWSQDAICALLAEKAKMLKLSRNTLFLDATGSLVKKMDKSSKRVFYYALIANSFEHQISLPIAEAVLSSHYTYDIKMWLTKLRQYCVQIKMWPITKRVCTDASHAITNAAIGAFNIDRGINDLEEYLDACNEFLSEKRSRPNFIIVQWCSSHFSKIIIKDVKRYVDPGMQSFVLKAIGIGFNLHTLQQCDEWFQILCIIFLSTYKSKIVENAFDKLKLLHEGHSNPLETFEMTSYDPSGKYVSKTLYAKSPFWKRYNTIKDEVVSRINDNVNYGTNTFCNPIIMDVILKRYCAFLPLWTNVIGVFVETTAKSRISNAPIESYFKNIKCYNIAAKNIKANRFAKLTHTNMQAQISQIYFNILNYKKNVDHKRQKCANIISKIPNATGSKDNNVEDLFKRHTLDSKETWKKTNKNIKIFSSKQLFSQQQYNSDSTLNQTPYYTAYMKDLFEEITPGCSSNFELFLTDGDINSLRRDEEATNFIIDAACAAVIKKTNIPNIQLISCTRSYFLLETKMNDEKLIRKIIPSKPDILVVPILKNHHYTVIIIDFIKKIFYYIDPQGRENKTEDMDANFEKFQKILELLNITIDNFEKIVPAHDTQKDAFNCGPFIVEFIECVLLEKSLINLQSRRSYREYIADEIMKNNSAEIKDVCIHCARLYPQSHIPWVQCEECSRWLCELCLLVVFKKDVNAIKNDKFLCYKCK